MIWTSSGQDGSIRGVFGQRFDGGGMAQGGEFQVNTFTTNSQSLPAVSHGSSGFVVVWTSRFQDGSDYGVFGQRFDSARTPQGGEFQINSYTTGDQLLPAVSHDASGGFVVVWESINQDGSARGIFGQRFLAARLATGPSVGGASKARRYEGTLFLAQP